MKKYFFIFALLALIGCSSDSESNVPTSNSDTGKGGSLARFTIVNDYLYTVDNQSLNVFNISTPENPVKVNEIVIGFNIETLFNYREYLYIGSRNGMFIYNTEDPEAPSLLSDVQHFTACDPVVANATHAFVTLHADIGCGTDINVLEIYNIEDIETPRLISSRNLTKPIGLALYNNHLFVCDDEVKVFDITNPESIQLVHAIEKSAFDVIIKNNLLILIGDNGLFQYNLDENNIQNTTELSTINI